MRTAEQMFIGIIRPPTQLPGRDLRNDEFDRCEIGSRAGFLLRTGRPARLIPPLRRTRIVFVMGKQLLLFINFGVHKQLTLLRFTVEMGDLAFDFRFWPSLNYVNNCNSLGP
jgi:hypothetical protein